jgi:hypothetical protein
MTDFNNISFIQIISVIFGLISLSCFATVVFNIIPSIGWQIIGGIVFAILAFISFLIDDTNDFRSDSVSTIQWILGIVIIILLFSTFAIGLTGENRTALVSSNTYDIYSVTAPFGMVYRDTSASMHGSVFLFAGAFSGSMNTQVSENYATKYMIGDELHSITCKASDTPIKIDGNFTITINYYKHYSWNTYWNVKSTHDDTFSYGYIIHLPSLPQLNQTLTDDYRIVG